VRLELFLLLLLEAGAVVGLRTALLGEVVEQVELFGGWYPQSRQYSLELGAQPHQALHQDTPLSTLEVVEKAILTTIPRREHAQVLAEETEQKMVALIRVLREAYL
jgi:hypothetical protein